MLIAGTTACCVLLKKCMISSDDTDNIARMHDNALANLDKNKHLLKVLINKLLDKCIDDVSGIYHECRVCRFSHRAISQLILCDTKYDVNSSMKKKIIIHNDAVFTFP